MVPPPSSPLSPAISASASFNFRDGECRSCASVRNSAAENTTARHAKSAVSAAIVPKRPDAPGLSGAEDGGAPQGHAAGLPKTMTLQTRLEEIPAARKTAACVSTGKPENASGRKLTIEVRYDFHRLARVFSQPPQARKR